MPISLSDFADQLNNIMPVIIKEFASRQTNELYKGKITMPQFLILSYLYANGESKMKDLADFVKVTSAAMTGIIDRLVKYDYVKRVFEPDDRRIIKIKLTPKGEALVAKINRQRREMVISIFGRITEAEREEYLRILMRIHDIMTEEAKEK